MRGRQLDALAGEPKRGLDEAAPGQPAVRAPERVEARREARHGARGRPDRVVDDLLAEGDRQLERARSPSPDGTVHEAVEEARRPRPSQ